MTDALMTVDEVAAYLKMHPTTVYRLVRRRKLPSFRVGKNFRFLQSDIDQLMNRPVKKP
jgi:excisionase family DNA binding protein